RVERGSDGRCDHDQRRQARQRGDRVQAKRDAFECPVAVLFEDQKAAQRDQRDEPDVNEEGRDAGGAALFHAAVQASARVEGKEHSYSMSPFLYASNSRCTLSSVWLVSSSSLVRDRICWARRSRSRASESSISWYFTCTIASSVTLRCTSSAPTQLPAASTIGTADRMKRMGCSWPATLLLISSRRTCRFCSQHCWAMQASLQMSCSS